VEPPRGVVMPLALSALAMVGDDQGDIMTSSNPNENLTLEDRGSKVSLIRTDSRGQRTEIPLSETSIVRLSRALPQFIRRMLARNVPAKSGLSAIATIPVNSIELKTDIYNSKVLMTIHDQANGQYDFDFPVLFAHQLGEHLIARAAKAEAAARQTTEQ
jgi:hypothetical protein